MSITENRPQARGLAAGFYVKMKIYRLELGTGSNESLTGFVSFIFLEVLDETFSKIFCLNCPFLGVSVGVAGIKDLGIYAGKFSGNLEVKDGELLGGSIEDSAVKDSVDDAAGVTD